MKSSPYIGSNLPRKEGVAKVTGVARYIDDIQFPNMIYGKTIRSPIARGKITSIEYDSKIDWSEFVVVEAKDIEHGNHVALILEDQPYLADGVVNHPEEPVVLIAHKDKNMLAKAMKHVHIHIEPLPPVFDMEESLANQESIWGDDNIFKRIDIDKGDVDAAFADKDPDDIVVEGRYETGAQEQLYIETNGAIAYWTDQGVEIWGSMQCPYYVQKAISGLFGLTDDNIRIVQAETGGGFGGKEEYPSMICGHAALLAKKAGCPVKMIYDRAEDMVATTKRHPSRTIHRTLVSKSGQLKAMDIDFLLDGGAYATLSAVVLSRGAIHAAGPYLCPNTRITSRAVATNLPPHGAFRGFGAPQSIFALERQLDKVAAALKMSPKEFRDKNYIKPQQQTATQQTVKDPIDMERLTQTAFEMTSYQEKRAQFDRDNVSNDRFKKGIGFATFYHGAGFTGSGEKRLESVVGLKAGQDGKVEVLASSTEIGQGTNTIFSQIAADQLGIGFDMIQVARPDTQAVPDSGPTVASRTVMVVGQLVAKACDELKSKLQASGHLKETYTQEEWQSACQAYSNAHGELSAQAQYIQPPQINWDEEKYVGDAYATYAWACYIAEVQVDTVTWETTVVDFVAVQDAGDIIHPKFAAGQIEGGVAQAIGYALYEKCKWQEGRMANGSMTNYIMPTSSDLPPIRVHFQTSSSPYGPGKGAKGIGELPMDGTAPAILNAIHQATGLNVDAIPCLPEDLFQAHANKETL